MKDDSPFLELAPKGRTVTVTFDGRAIEVADGANLAAALLAAGIRSIRRTPVSGAPRGPFCMMGACFDCLVEIDGINRQACLVAATDGLEIMPAGPRTTPHG